MSWLTRLDARAENWPTGRRTAYLALKWYLVLVGAMALTGVVADRLGIWSLY